MRKTIIIAALVLAAVLTSCERMAVRRIVRKETKATVEWLREDSCYSVTRPLMTARYNASKATRAWLEIARADLMRLNTQMGDRTTDHGGLKVRCYWVGYTRDGRHADSTAVMVEPSGELVTELDELTAWMEAADEIGRLSNSVFAP